MVRWQNISTRKGSNSFNSVSGGWTVCWCGNLLLKTLYECGIHMSYLPKLISSNEPSRRDKKGFQSFMFTSVLPFSINTTHRSSQWTFRYALFLRGLTSGNNDVSTSFTNKGMEREGNRTTPERGLLVSKLFLRRLRPLQEIMIPNPHSAWFLYTVSNFGYKYSID